MILVDANLLIYAHVSSFRSMRRRQWLDAQLSGATAWAALAVSWVSAHVTNPRVSSSRAWTGVAPGPDWLEPEVMDSQPTERHADVLGRLVHGGSGQSR